MVELHELRKLATAYSKNKVFTFVEEMIGGNKNFYNGYIVKVYDDMIMFHDHILKKAFPILFETIKILKPSNKEVEDGK